VKPGTTPTTPPTAPTLPADWHTVETIFDHVPDTVFFVKDAAGRYAAVNATLVQRCGLRHKAELIGRRVEEVFPRELGAVFAAQDARVLRTGRPIHDHLELHWYARGKPGWCLTTKLPLRDAAGRVAGLVGISRDLRAPGERDSIPASLADTLEFLEEKFAEPISPAQLAKRAGLSPVRFARLIKRIFRLTPSQLITQTRLAAAAQLLTDTGQSVAEIALACGFYDHSAFTRAFRSATGQTPTEFRGRR
jgi:PAS domain S-box-containing protein